MKTNYLLIIGGMLFLFGLSTVFQSCDDDISHVNADIRTTFDTKFPNAEMVEWEKSGKNFKASFYVNKVEKEALFSKSGEWLWTETDVLPSEVPEEIKNLLKKSEYATWSIDDIDYLENPTGSSYRFDLEKGNNEKIIHISPDGTIQ